MRPVLLDLPMPICTERLRLRPPRPFDGVELNAAVRESQAELAPWMPWADRHKTFEDSEEFCRVAAADWIMRANMKIAIFDRVTNQWLGGSGFHRIDWAVPRVELGYWVRTSCRGKGYITEAAAALTQYAFRFLNVSRVEIRCDADNQRSLAVPARLGFKLEGRLEKNHVKLNGGGLGDLLIFARTNADGLPDVGLRLGED